MNTANIRAVEQKGMRIAGTPQHINLTAELEGYRMGGNGDGGDGVQSEIDDGSSEAPRRSTIQLTADGAREDRRSQSREQRRRPAEIAIEETRAVSLYSERDFEREAPRDREDPWRRPVSVDWGRVVHCASFRRLQGKTQVFPGHESDFFRNRLTHSLEVAQIAEGIAEKLNYSYPENFREQQIDARLCAAAALMHDLGHAPFGHNGERALDDLMLSYGGFEGNAQSLRIIARLEKKCERETGEEINEDIDVRDRRLGLNLCYRTIASILKYDNKIPHVRRKGSKLKKGYYGSEAALVARVKQAVAPNKPQNTKFKTIECSIMDLADDIAYSTFDLEDCLKAGFLTPAKIMSTSEGILDKVARKVSQNIGCDFTRTQVLRVFDKLFEDLIRPEVFEWDIGEDTDETRRLKVLEQIADYLNKSDELFRRRL